MKKYRSYILLLVALVMMSGCKTKSVVVEKVHTDTCYITRLQRDSIRLHDSIYVKEYAKAESVFVEIERWHTAYRDRVSHDTVYVSRVDSIPVPYEVEKEVNHLYWWQKVLMWAGIACFSLLLVRVYKVLKM